MNPDQLAGLEEQRRFLLRSLVDLEREHAAGDVDEIDYHELKEGYTVRAAATLRAIDEGRSSLPTKSSPNWTRRALIAGGMLVAVLVLWWGLARWSAERTPGAQLSGLDPRSQQQQLMAQARAIQFESPGEASQLYAEVLETEPDNVEALTYRGWTLALDAVQRAGGADETVVPQLQAALDALLQATEVDPTYPDPKCFLGIVNFSFLRQAAAAQPWVEACLAADPPADIRDLVQGMNEELLAELESPATTTP